jgi:acetolactate synthase regulatory subunit
VNLVDELHAIARTLAAARVPYAICGGVAVTVHGATRSTKDIDVVIRPEDVDRVLELVRPLGYKFAALPMVSEAGTPRERHVQRVSKVVGADHLLLDLLLAESSFATALDDRLEVALPEGPLAVVSRATLVAMKRLAGRPQDLADLAHVEADRDR